MLNNERNLRCTIRHKHGSASLWYEKHNFVPKAGELVFYDSDDTHNTPRAKLGDGVTAVENLPFISDVEPISSSELDAILV